ncbi:TPA: TIGR02391 family protein, partial [Corynebacterium striatum]|nr:TIGR02391 family protein [Corynebacterium striatum]
MQSDSFSQRSTIRSIANVLASTDLPGLSGSQIDELLLDIGAPPRVAGSKREGLFGALTEGMSAAQAGQLTREFITTAMSPARHTTDRQRWNDLRRLLNKVLATEGWHIDDAGELTQLAEAARTFDDIERLTSSLVEELQRRGTHERLMEYCSQELIAESLFHAISEAAKSIPDRIRILTSLTDDGQELFDAALGTNNSAPKLVINSFSTESEKSEHKGFKNLLIGIHGHYRNPRAHKTRLGSEEGKHDFLDAFSLFSYVH